MVMLVAVIAWSFHPAGDVNPSALALLIPTLALVVVGIKVWGARSAWAWFVAALCYEALEGLRDAVYGVEWQARLAGVLSVLVAATLIALITRRAKPPRDIPTDEEVEADTKPGVPVRSE